MRSILLAAGLAASAAAAVVFTVAHADPAPLPRARTPIEHIVVVFGENESFDHYFGTYPTATNPPGETPFTGVVGNRAVDGLTDALLNHNTNTANPKRLDPSQAVTCDMNHGYGAEQKAFDGGAMDKFVQNTAGGLCQDSGIVMDYFDGNTVTGLWNLAQHFALNDASFGSGYGPSTPGALELISGNTHGAAPGSGVENGTIIADPDPALDDCGNGGAQLSGKNIGDLMTAAHVTWGWFQGGFRPTATVAGKAVCASTHTNVANAPVVDYSAHHEPFQYYATTANQHHLPPTSTAMIGQSDQANHQYDLADFDAALSAGNLPQVSFLKAAAFEDAHPTNSDPLDEQHFIARVLNALQQSPAWSSTAVFLAYDDSDGWYDHVFTPPLNGSAATSDALNGAGQCTGPGPLGGFKDRCGPGPRLPLLAISPYARQNWVDHTPTEQTSILQFIEDNWALGHIDDSFDARAGSLDGMFDFAGGPVAPKVYLDPGTGEVVGSPPPGPIGPPHPATPTPTATATAVPTAVPTATPTPRPAPFKLRCTASGKGRKLHVSCAGSGTGATTVRTTLKLTVTRSGRTVVTGKGALSKGKAKIVLKPKHALKKGTYTLRIAITRAGKTTTARQTFKIK